MAGVGAAASCDARACWGSFHLWPRHLFLLILLLPLRSSSCHAVAAAAAALWTRRRRMKRRPFYPLQLEEGRSKGGRTDDQEDLATQVGAAKCPGEGVLSWLW